jgi:hypothetical protein
MDQQLFNHLVYWALKYYQVRMFAEGDAHSTQIGAARYFFSSLWNATNNIAITDELLDDLLNEDEIDLLAYQYRLVQDSTIMLEVQEYYTQLVVRKLNYYSHSYYTWTWQADHSFPFWEYLLLTHQLELGIGLLSGVASGLTLMANQSQVATIVGIPGMGILSWFGFYYYQWQKLQQHPLEIPSKYIVNPHQQYKIWLSSHDDKEIPDGLMNYILQNREAASDKMVLVYDRALMTTRLHESLLGYCDMNGVKTMDIRKEVFPACKTNEEQMLIDIYQQEILHRSAGGSLKAARQVLCWLKPIYELGLYTDLDLTLDLRNLPTTYAFNKPLIFNICHEWELNDNPIQINSDAMMVVNVDDAQPLILKIQREIINAYVVRHPEHSIDLSVIKRFKQSLWGHDIGEGYFERLDQTLQDEKDGLTLRKELFACVAGVESQLRYEQQQEVQEYKRQVEQDVIKQTSGGGLILRIIFSYVQAQLNGKNNERQITEYGFEHYTLSHRFHHKRDEEEQYEDDERKRHLTAIKNEILNVLDLKQEIVQESAKIIQRFFKMNMAAKQDSGEVQKIASDWELISRI